MFMISWNTPVNYLICRAFALFSCFISPHLTWNYLVPALLLGQPSPAFCLLLQFHQYNLEVTAKLKAMSREYQVTGATGCQVDRVSPAARRRSLTEKVTCAASVFCPHLPLPYMTFQIVTEVKDAHCYLRVCKNSRVSLELDFIVQLFLSVAYIRYVQNVHRISYSMTVSGYWY